MANNDSTIEKYEDSDINYKVAVNSIQRTLHVERLHVNVARINDVFLPYDIDNLYPQKIEAIAARSGTTSSAIGTLSSFISGDGFVQMSQVINREKQTLWDILRFISDQKAMFKGFALHFNYNLRGQITEINPVNFEFVRWERSLKKFVVNPDWKRRQLRRKDEVIYNLFKPDNVINEINECRDIYKYTGQLYYWIPNLSNYYTPCTWDSVIDDAQFEAEAKLYSLSGIQNDYALGGFITLPQNLTSQEQIDDFRKELAKDKGSNNAGGTRVFSVMPSENLTNWKYFTPISRNNIDGLHTNQSERAVFNIYAAFRQPPILNGVSKDGMFNQLSFADAFHYYNNQTETERKEVERELNKILSYSIWAGLGNIQITPKSFALRTEPVAAPAAQPL